MKFIENGTITSPFGFLTSGIHCGLKKKKRDLALIYSVKDSVAAGVYTKNKVKGAPIYVTREHLIDGNARAIIINSGNANTCNGDSGIKKANEMTELVAKELKIDSSDVLVCSTGVIGVPLPIEKIKDSITPLVTNLSVNYGKDACEAIMTTDTIEKSEAVSINLQGKEVKIGSICKGSGMIEPNMCTMLSFITTDISISKELLKEALKTSVDLSYNRISVDGDSSTNDTVLILANGMAKNPPITTKNEDYYTFLDALNALNIRQAKKIASDGEGATKLISCKVTGAKTEEDGVLLSKSVIKSPLVKTAIFGSDANWGRILCALGYSGGDFNPALVDVSFNSEKGSIKVCLNGSSLPFDEELATSVLSSKEIEILVSLKEGTHEVICWGCDLTYDYVKINGDYRS